MNLNQQLFVLKVNNPKLVHFFHQRYLENKLRQGFGFRGVPLKLIFTRTAVKSIKRWRREHADS